MGRLVRRVKLVVLAVVALPIPLARLVLERVVKAMMAVWGIRDLIRTVAAAAVVVMALSVQQVVVVQEATVATEPRATGSVLQPLFTQAVAVALAALVVARVVLAAAPTAMWWEGQPRTVVAALVVCITVVHIQAVRVLSSSDTRWLHNG